MREENPFSDFHIQELASGYKNSLYYTELQRLKANRVGSNPEDDSQRKITWRVRTNSWFDTRREMLADRYD